MPSIVLYSNHLIPERYGGINYLFLIIIRPKYRGDIGLLEHEKRHVNQFWRSFGVIPFMMLFNQKWRLKYELECYKLQLTLPPRWS